MGVALPDTILDPVIAREMLLALAKGEN